MAKSTKDTKDAKDAKGGKDEGSAGRRSGGANRARAAVAQAVWIATALLALVLALGALLVTVDATNESNGLVKFVLDLADGIDFGVLDRRDGVMKFSSPSANALVNWGLAAVVWLVLGRVAERVIRP